MAGNGKESNAKDLRKDVQGRRAREVEPQSLSTATLRTLSPDTLAKLKDSVIENMGALQFLLDREQTLKELLLDCRVVADAHGHKVLVNKIDAATL